MAQTVKCLSTMRETRVRCGRSLGWEDPPEKEMAIHSSTITWKIPWTEEPGRLQSMGSQRVGPDWVTSLSLLILIPKQRFFRKPNWPLILTISEVKNLKIAHLFSNSVTNRGYTPDFKMSYPNYWLLVLIYTENDFLMLINKSKWRSKWIKYTQKEKYSIWRKEKTFFFTTLSS